MKKKKKRRPFALIIVIIIITIYNRERRRGARAQARGCRTYGGGKARNDSLCEAFPPVHRDRRAGRRPRVVTTRSATYGPWCPAAATVLVDHLRPSRRRTTHSAHDDSQRVLVAAARNRFLSLRTDDLTGRDAHTSAATSPVKLFENKENGPAATTRYCRRADPCCSRRRPCKSVSGRFSILSASSFGLNLIILVLFFPH